MANNQNIVELCPVTLYFELTHATILFLSFALTYISILNPFHSRDKKRQFKSCSVSLFFNLQT